MQHLLKSNSVKPEHILETFGPGTDEVLSSKSYTEDDLGGRILSRKINNYNTVRTAVRMKHLSEASQSGSRSFAKLKLLFDIHTYFNLLRSFLTSEIFQVIVALLDLVCDVFFCVLYVINIQHALNHMDEIPLTLPGPSWLWVARLPVTFIMCAVLSYYTFISWVLELFWADNPIKQFFSFLTLVNAVTSFPFMFGVFFDIAKYLYLPFYLRSLVAVGHLRKVLRLRGATNIFNFSVVVEKTIILVASLMVLIYVGMLTFQIVEFRFGDRYLNAFDCFYFVTVTLATVGYGDISASTTAGKIVVIAIMFSALTLLPVLITPLVSSLVLSDDDTKRFVRGKANYSVILGHFETAVQINDTLEGLLHAEAKNDKVVILGREPANQHVLNAITTYQYKDRVTYLVGSGMDAKDLERAKVRHATAIYIIPNRSVDDRRKEDQKNTLRAWAVHNYAPNVPLFVNNLLPDSESYQEMNVHASLCVDDLKQLLLALTTMYDGASALLINLLHVSSPKAKYDSLWETQYGDGFGNETFVIPVIENWVGLNFIEVSCLAFQEFQINVVGVRVFSEAAQCRILVFNPGAKYILAPTDEIVLIAQKEEDFSDFINLTQEALRSIRRKNGYETNAKEVSLLIDSKTIESPSPAAQFMKTVQKIVAGVVGNGAVFHVPNIPLSDTEVYLDVPKAPYFDSNIPRCNLAVNKQPIGELRVKSASDWKGHLIACTGDYDVFKFVCGLRASHLKSRYRILFLCERAPTAEEYEVLQVFPDIHFMVGDPLQKRVLLTAGLNGCEKVVVMKMGEYEAADDFNGSTAIMVSHLIYHMYQRKEIDEEKCVILEATKRNLIKYVPPTSSTSRLSHRWCKRANEMGSKPLSMSGKLEVTGQPLVEEDVDVSNEVHFFYAPVFAAGRVITASMLDSMIYHFHKHPTRLDVFLVLCGVDHHYQEVLGLQGVVHSNLKQIRMPTEFVNRTYGELYRELAINHGIIPLGLYRNANDELRNSLPFVFTNPLPGVLLKEDDLVFVLAPK